MLKTSLSLRNAEFDSVYFSTKVRRRLSCTVSGQKIILLHGFIKKTDKTPKKEKDIAVKRMQEVMHG